MATRHKFQVMTFALSLLILLGDAQTQAIDSTWLCGSGQYSNTTCWDPLLAVPPCNFDPFYFNVIIPSGGGVITVDVNVCEVNSLYLGAGRMFKVLPGGAYSVLGQADIYGHVHGNKGNFIAPIAAFPEDAAQAWVDFGAYVEIGASEYDATGLNANYTNYVLFSAKGPGSTLDLSKLTEIDDGVSIGGGSYHHTIEALEGGFIDLSSLTTITGPTAEDYLNIDVASGGDIEMGSLSALAHAGSTGRIRFNLDALEGDVHIELPSLSSVSDTEFHAANGAIADACDSEWTYSAQELNANYTSYTLISSTGTNSRLNLSGMTKLIDGMTIGGGAYTHTIEATNGGLVDVNGLTEIVGPWNDDYLIVRANTAGRIYLDSLTSLSNAGGGGGIRFDLDGDACLELPALSSVSNTEFVTADGACLEASVSSWTYDVGGLNSNYTNYALLSAKGSGTILDLSGMTKLDDGAVIGGGAYNHTIEALEGGFMDLGGLRQLIGPGDNESLNINVSSGGAIDLTDLATVHHDSRDGRVCFNLDGDVQLELPSLSSVSDTEFHLTNGAMLNADKSAWAYSAADLNANYTNYVLFSAEGTGSFLDLSGMTELDDSVSIAGGPYSHSIVARDGGVIDFSDLTDLAVPSADDSLDIEAHGGIIAMPSLRTIGGNGEGVGIDVTEGGGFSLGDVTSSVPVDIVLSEDATLEATSDLDLVTNVSVSNPNNGSVYLNGDFTYAHTDETKVLLGNAYVHLVGDGPQEVEVGGFDIGVYTDFWVLDPPDNFGYGQMVIGEPNKATTVLLVDNVDNGNKPGAFDDPDEALYLFGKDGMDGLIIHEDCTLYMNGLSVYVASGNGERPTDLRTLFAEGQERIPFDDGWICLGVPGDPGNLVANGGFEMGVDRPTAADPVRILPDASSVLDAWDVAQNTVDWTHETIWPDAGDGERFVVLGGDLGGGAVSQTLSTVPGELYRVYFDVAAIPSAGTTEQLTVSAAGDSETFTFEAGDEIQWLKKTWRFTAVDESTTLTFGGTKTDPNAVSGIAIDNVVIPVDNCVLTVEATIGGSVTVTEGDSPTLIGPGEKVDLFYDCAVMLNLLAKAEEGYHFAGWVGSVGVDSNSVSTEVLLDGNQTLKAVFEADVFHTLTLGVGVGGSVTVDDGDSVIVVSGPDEVPLTYPTGQVLVLTAEAGPDYDFVGWTGSTSMVLELTLDQDMVLPVEFLSRVFWQERLDSDPGWTMTGQWAFGVPTGQRCGSHGNEDPTAGDTGQNVIGVNLDGCYDLTVGGPYSVVAGPIDASGYRDIELRFYRWLNADWPEFVTSVLEFSTDGENWNLLWENPSRTEVTDTEWVPVVYPLGSLADDQPTLYLRWSYKVVQERAYAYTGWNIDDIQLLGRRQ